MHIALLYLALSVVSLLLLACRWRSQQRQKLLTRYLKERERTRRYVNDMSRII